MRVNKNSYNDGEERVFWVVLGVWLMCVLAGLAFWAGVIYVAIHFIAKFW